MGKYETATGPPGNYPKLFQRYFDSLSDNKNL